MECRIAAAIAEKTDCGCNTKLIPDQKNNKESSPLHQHHLKNYTEEFFDHHFTTLTELASLYFPTNSVFTSCKPPTGYKKGIFQPPRM